MSFYKIFVQCKTNFFLLCNHSPKFIQIRWLSSAKPNSELPKGTSKSNQSNGTSKSDIKQYLKSKTCLSLVSNFIPNRFLRVQKMTSSYSFIVDDDIAVQFLHLIKNDLSSNIPVLEANPGLGLVTRQLLMTGIHSHITVFDPTICPMPPLIQLINDNPDRITIIPSNFFEIHKIIIQDKMDNGDRFNTVFKNFEWRAWEDEPTLTVIGAVLNPYYLHGIIKSIIFHHPFVKLGRIQHFLSIADDVYESIRGTENMARLRTYTLINLFFDLELKGELPRCAFLPWDKGKRKLANNISSRKMYVVKITPKSDIFKKFSEDKLKVLWYFIQDLCRLKSNKVVAYFEKWVPSSGLILIKEGLSPTTEVSDLTEQEILQLFFTFTSLPGFADTNYIHIQESFVLNESQEPPKQIKTK